MLEHPKNPALLAPRGSDNATGADNQQERPAGTPESSETTRPTLTRQEALACGATRYHGRPCKTCGGTDRYVQGGCVACNAIRTRKTYRRRQAPVGHAYVYRCFNDADELLYVGRTNNPSNRLNTHQQGTPWWHEVTRITWTLVCDLERQWIAELNPLYNKEERV